MGKGSQNVTLTDTKCSPDEYNNDDAKKAARSFKWSEIRKHRSKDDLWIVLSGQVYDVTKFRKVHPGGSQPLVFYGGQDATEVAKAFHKETERVSRLMKLYHIGSVADEDEEQMSERQRQAEQKRASLKKDFEDLRLSATQTGLFKPSYFFFFLQALQIVFFNYIAYFILWDYGTGLLPFALAALCQIIGQGQASWNQHDYGHSSLLTKPKHNRYMQMFFLGTLKGASSEWWAYMHNQHHAKPNVIGKDPDICVEPVYVFGKTQPILKAEQNVKFNKKNLYSFDKQHFFFPFLAPILFPVYFQIMTIRYALMRRTYLDLFAMLPHYLLNYFILPYSIGLGKGFLFVYLVKFVDSTWFAWVSQTNHVVMDVHEDDPQDTWLNLQLKGTCNIEQSWFNDWFTGHLNFQIEHHLFPTMPRHNLYKIQPLCESLCKKYDVEYVIKPLGQSFLDILLSLKKSGKLWREAYDELAASM